jgi:phenylpyruvate tautomerase PptA (4-oxalocrotonate tautomerase family)
MPLVEISLFPGRSEDQKLAIARAISDALVELGNATPESVDVVYREVERGDWFKVDQLRRDA